MERLIYDFVDEGDLKPLVKEIAKCFEKIKASDEPMRFTDDLIETMKEYYGDVSEQVRLADVDIDSLANLFFLKSFIQILEDEAHKEDFDPSFIYETDVYKEFEADNIKYFYKNTNFKKKMKKLFNDIF